MNTLLTATIRKILGQSYRCHPLRLFGPFPAKWDTVPPDDPPVFQFLETVEIPYLAWLEKRLLCKTPMLMHVYAASIVVYPYCPSFAWKGLQTIHLSQTAISALDLLDVLSLAADTLTEV